MKIRYQLILGLVALLLCGLVWWVKRPVALPLAPIQEKITLPSTPASLAAAKPPQSKAAVTAPTHANAAPSGDAVPKRKLSEIDLLEGSAVMNEIANKDLLAIFQHFLDAGRAENDEMKQSGLSGILAEAILNRKPDPVFLKKLQEFIESDTPSARERGMMLDTLGRAGTKEAGELLLHEAATLNDTKLRGTAIQCVSNLGDAMSWKRGEITPALVRVWKATNDPGLMAATARSMARLGSAESIELLLAAALAPDGQDDVRRSTAERAVRRVYADSAAPPLAAVLAANPVGSRANTLAFEVLTRLGPTAQKAIMEWLQTTDRNAAPFATHWVISNRSNSQELAQAALDPAVPFRSEENRRAIRAGLEAYRAEEVKNRGK